MKRFYSNGKLLLSGEYVVLDGATALSLATRYGQSLEVQPMERKVISWQSRDETGGIWFEADFKLEDPDFPVAPGNPTGGSVEEFAEIANKLREILIAANLLNPSVLSGETGFQVLTRMDFKRSWGLGSSSTLINNIAQWFGIDAFVLLQNTFKGSGYDIASAQNSHPVTFSLTPAGRTIFTARFDPSFKSELFFVHLNRKQDSRNSIAHYRNQPKEKISRTIDKISSISSQLVRCSSLTEFELLLEIHETLISGVLNTPRIKTSLFPDFPRTIKSLGGWGGDFVLATGGTRERDYFRQGGYPTIIDYTDMIL